MLCTWLRWHSRYRIKPVFELNLILLYEIPRTAVTKYLKLGLLNDRDIWSHGSGGYKYYIKMSSRVSSLRGGMCSRPLCQLLGLGWCSLAVDTSLCCLPLCSHDILPVCVHTASFIRTPVTLDWVPLYSSVTSSLLTTSARTYFQVSSYSEVLEIRISTYEYWGDTVSPITGMQDSFHHICRIHSWISP